MEGGGGCARPSGYAGWQFHRRPQVCAARAIRRRTKVPHQRTARAGGRGRPGAAARPSTPRALLRRGVRRVRGRRAVGCTTNRHPRGGTPMVRPDKVTAVAEIAEKFRSSSASVVTEYRGLSMAQADDPASFARRGHDLSRRQEHAGPAGRGGRGRRGSRADARRPHGDRVHHRRAGRRGQGDPRFRQDQPGLGDQGRLHGRSRADRHRGQPARRTGVARGPAGQAGRRHEGQPQQGRGPVRGACVAGRPPRAGTGRQAGRGGGRLGCRCRSRRGHRRGPEAAEATEAAADDAPASDS